VPNRVIKKARRTPKNSGDQLDGKGNGTSPEGSQAGSQADSGMGIDANKPDASTTTPTYGPYMSYGYITEIYSHKNRNERVMAKYDNKFKFHKQFVYEDLKERDYEQRKNSYLGLLTDKLSSKKSDYSSTDDQMQELVRKDKTRSDKFKKLTEARQRYKNDIAKLTKEKENFKQLSNAQKRDEIYQLIFNKTSAMCDIEPEDIEKKKQDWIEFQESGNFLKDREIL